MPASSSRVRPRDLVARLRAAGCVFAEAEARLIARQAQSPVEAERLVALRESGRPLEHVLGWVEFLGSRVLLDPGVFVPRRRTELLARTAIGVVRPGHTVVDLCCGAGAVGVAIVAAVGGVRLFGADLDPAAVRCARRNLPPDTVFEGDLFEALPATLRGGVDVLVANAPYVPTDALPLMPVEARRFEARMALDGGDDGLDVQRRIAVEAPLWLTPGGVLLIETSGAQANGTADIMRDAGLRPRIVASKRLDATVVLGSRGIA
jgi:release factor glutamine methyltransferase